MNIRCIKCQSENSFLNRQNNDRRCRSCNHRFVFEPDDIVIPNKTRAVEDTTIINRISNSIGTDDSDFYQFKEPTDVMFANTLDELSDNNTLFFTQTQLIYCLDKRLPRASDFESFESTFTSYFQSLVKLGEILERIFEKFWVGSWQLLGVIFVSLLVNLFVNGNLPTPEMNFPYGSILIITIMIWEGLRIWMFYRKSISKTLSDRHRRINARKLRNVGFYLLIIVVPIILRSPTIERSFFLFAVAVMMAMGSIYLGNRQLSSLIIKDKELFIDSDRIKSWLNRWQLVNGDIIKLLPPIHAQTGSSMVNPDVQAYSFNRLVVCQSAEVAQILITNNFHSKSNCVILSIDGYPENILDVTMEMLRHNARLNVYIFHDCSPQGLSVLHQLKTSDRCFNNSNVEIIDIGLTPNQVMTSKNIFLQTSKNSAKIAKRVPTSEWMGLTKYEISWLKRGNYVELESLTPQQLMEVLNRGIAGNKNLLDISYG